MSDAPCNIGIETLLSNRWSICVYLFCVCWLFQAPIDDSTKTMLMAAIGLIGVTGAIAGGRTAVKAVQERLKASQEVAQQLVVKGAFYLAVFLAACAVLELELQL